MTLDPMPFVFNDEMWFLFYILYPLLSLTRAWSWRVDGRMA